MKEENEPDASEQPEQWMELCERLQEQIESLREQLAASKTRIERLTAIVDAEAEDLQQFGAHWFRPSAVVSVTRDNSLGVMINGSPIGWTGSSMRGDATDQEMQAISQEINRQNALKRARARQE